MMLIIITCLISIVGSIAIQVTRINLGVVNPIDSVLLSNQSLLIANKTDLYILNPHTSTPLKFAFNTNKSSILNLASTSSFVCICTTSTVYLLHQQSLILYGSAELYGFQQYSHITIVEQSGQIYYIPAGLSTTEIFQYKWGATPKKRFFSSNAINHVDYLEGHKFILVTDAAGEVHAYDSNSQKTTDSLKVCNTSADRTLPYGANLTVICSGIIYNCQILQSKLSCNQIDQKGFQLAFFRQQMVFMINSSYFLVRNGTSTAITQKIDQIGLIVSASVVFQDGLLKITAMDADGVLLKIDIKGANEQNTVSLWNIIQIGIGCALLIAISVFIFLRLKKNCNKKFSSAYNGKKDIEDYSQITQGLLDKQIKLNDIK